MYEKPVKMNWSESMRKRPAMWIGAVNDYGMQQLLSGITEQGLSWAGKNESAVAVSFFDEQQFQLQLLCRYLLLQ